jgi:hypothetical protein
MQKLYRGVVLAALATGLTATADAADLTLRMANGRVTLIAQDVPLRQILAEWARVGQTRIINADKLIGPPITLELVDCPEGQALDILLRSAAGYMAAPRIAGQAGVSLYDRIMILPVSRPPAVASNPTPAPFNRAAAPQPMPAPVVDDDNDQEPAPGPPGMPPGAMQPGMQPQPGVQQMPAGAVPADQQPVLTSPRPGMLPQPTSPGVVNPYAPPGTRPPATARPGGGNNQN